MRQRTLASRYGVFGIAVFLESPWSVPTFRRTRREKNRGSAQRAPGTDRKISVVFIAGNLLVVRPSDPWRRG
jgi:hypothetical protein